MKSSMIFLIPSLLLCVRAASLVPASAAARVLTTSTSAALLVDDSHVVGKIADVVVHFAVRYLAMDLWQRIKSELRITYVCVEVKRMKCQELKRA